MSDFETLSDGEYTAVVDAIEDGLATVFVEQDGEEVGDAVIAAERLPDDARHADAILTVEITEGEVSRMSYDTARTETRKQAAQDRFDRLSSRPPQDDDSN